MKIIFFNAQNSGTTWGDGTSAPNAQYNDTPIRLNISRGFSVDGSGFLLDELGNQITYTNQLAETGPIKLVKDKQSHIIDNHNINPNSILSNVEIGNGAVREIVSGKYDISYDNTYFPFTMFMTLDEDIISDTTDYFVIELRGLHKNYQLNSYQGIRYNPGYFLPNTANHGAYNVVLNYVFIDENTGDMSVRSEQNIEDAVGLGIVIYTNRLNSSTRNLRIYMGQLKSLGNDINGKINLNIYDANYDAALTDYKLDSGILANVGSFQSFPSTDGDYSIDLVRGVQGYALRVGTTEGGNDIIEERIGLAGLVNLPSNILCIPCFAVVKAGAGGVNGFDNGGGIFDLKFHSI